MKACRNCRFAQSSFGGLDELEDEDIVLCEWHPPVLPLSWEYARREVTGMEAGSTGCPAFEPKEDK